MRRFVLLVIAAMMLSSVACEAAQAPYAYRLIIAPGATRRLPAFETFSELRAMADIDGGRLQVTGRYNIGPGASSVWAKYPNPGRAVTDSTGWYPLQSIDYLPWNPIPASGDSIVVKNTGATKLTVWLEYR